MGRKGNPLGQGRGSRGGYAVLSRSSRGWKASPEHGLVVDEGPEVLTKSQLKLGYNSPGVESKFGHPLLFKRKRPSSLSTFGPRRPRKTLTAVEALRYGSSVLPLWCRPLWYPSSTWTPAPTDKVLGHSKGETGSPKQRQKTLVSEWEVQGSRPVKVPRKIETSSH